MRVLNTALAATVLSVGAAPAQATVVPAESRGRGGVVRLYDHGPDVLLLQRRLRELHFDPGEVNGYYGSQTMMAVWGFQKLNGVAPGNFVGPKTWSALRHPRRPRRLGRRAPANRVEIDLRRQLLSVYRRGRPVLITHVSAGARRHYCQKGRCGFAVTPVGDFRVYRRDRGWRVGPLGAMYDPMYFVGGIAMHGSTDVPLRPASHGCVRIPLRTASLVYRLVRKGEPVLVRRPRR